MKQLLLIALLTFATPFIGLSANSFSMDQTEIKALLNGIEPLDFPSNQYFKEVTEKTQVCLHHTASGKGISGDHRQFLKPGKICTPIIIGADTIYQLHSSRFWGYHLGIKSNVFAQHDIAYQNLNKVCIGVEIDNWGALKHIDGEYRAWPNDYGTGNRLDSKGKQLKVVVDSTEVIHYPEGYRGYEYYQRYTDYQIQATTKLLKYWNHVYNIPLTYNEDMWDVSMNALKGSPGVYTHTSYRSDKSDCHPQPNLISALKSLNT